MNKQNEVLETFAIRALGDISNQQLTSFNWLTKGNFRKRIKTDDPNALPSVSISIQNTQKIDLRNKNIFTRKKSYLCKGRMNEILELVQKKKSLPNYNINKQLSQKISQINRQSNNMSYTSQNNRISSQKKRCYTEQRYSNEQQLDQKSPINNKSCINEKSLQFQKRNRKNYSVNMNKMMQSLRKSQQNGNKQIDEIRQLIQDKRSKCRKLSKQGYLILKNQFSYDNKQQSISQEFQSLKTVPIPINNSIEFKSAQKNVFQGEKGNKRILLKSLKNSRMNNGSQNQISQLGNLISCKNFLTQAHNILHLRPINKNLIFNSIGLD